MKNVGLRQLFVVTLALLTLNSLAVAKPASVIEAEVNEAVKQFNSEVVGGARFLSKVKGYLVFPSVIKAGFVIGGEYGEGALRVQGKTKRYYSIASGSIGLQAGAQKTSYVIAFISNRALKAFLRSDGWEAGVDGSLTVFDWGAGKDISTISFEKPIVAFVFNAKGLMYNLTLEGTKFSPISR